MTERTNRTLAFLTLLLLLLVVYYLSAPLPHSMADDYPGPEVGPVFRPPFIFTFVTLSLAGFLGIWFTPARRRRGAVIIAAVGALLFYAMRGMPGYEWRAGLIAVGCLVATLLICFWPGRARQEDGESLPPP